MDINVRLSAAACVLLSTLASVFVAGFKYGEEHAAKPMSHSANEGLLCLPRNQVAIAPYDRSAENAERS